MSDNDPSIGVMTASVDITPETTCELGGYAESRPWGRIEDRLEANMIRFDDGTRTLVLISLDTLYIGRDLLAYLEETLRSNSPDRPVELITFASHTHFAPMLDPAKPKLGAVDPGYAALVRSRLREAIERMAEGMGERACVRSFEGETGLTVNRRLTKNLRTLKGRLRARTETFLAPNPAGYVDPRLRIKLVENEAGLPRAALVHFGCHPTSSADRTAVSADYVDAIRSAIRDTVNAPIPVIFLQGCAGDVRTSIQGGEGLRSALRTFAIGPHFPPVTSDQWRIWKASLGTFVENLLRDPADAKALVGRIAADRQTIPLDEIIEGGDAERSLDINAARVGGEIDILALNAEPLAHWTLCFPSQVLVAGYSGDCFGYLPRQSDVAAGGYEVDGHQAFLDLPSARWREGFENRIKAATATLLQPER